MSRIEKKDILELEKRRKIYNYILTNPGLHVRELSRKLKIPKTTLKYHLRYLEIKQLLNSETKGKCVRYFAKFEIGSYDKRILSIIRQKIPRWIIFISFLYDEVYINEISYALEIPLTTVFFHLKKLKGLNIIKSQKKNKRAVYSLQNRSYIYDIIIRYKESLADDPIFSAFLLYIKTDFPEDKAIKNNHIKDQYLDKTIEDIFKMLQIPFCA